jgi:hypothetical protein
MVEIAAVEGMPEHPFDPEQAVPADGETFYMRLGGPSFGVKTETKLRKGLRSTVTLSAVGVYKLEIWPEDKIFLERDIEALGNSLVAQKQRGEFLVEQWEKEWQDKKTPKQRKELLKPQILNGQNAIGQLDSQIAEVTALIEQSKSLGTGGKIHFRIYTKAGEHEIDLVKSNSLPEPKPKAEPAKRPANRAGARPANRAAAAK